MGRRRRKKRVRAREHAAARPGGAALAAAEALEDALPPAEEAPVGAEPSDARHPSGQDTGPSANGDAPPALSALEEAPVVVDLDADLDEANAADALAEVLATTAEEPEAPEPPPIDLDDAAEGDKSHVPAASSEAATASATAAADGTGTPGATPSAPAEPEPETSTADTAAADTGRPLPFARAEVSTPELRSRLLAEAVAHAEHKDARYRVPYSDSRTVARWKTGVAALLLLVAGTVALAPPAWVRPAPPAQLQDATVADNLRLALLLQAQQVEAYRIARQTLPASLAELPATLPGIRYVRSDNRAYQLIAYGPGGQAIVYDSVDPAPAFADLRAPWSDHEERP